MTDLIAVVQSLKFDIDSKGRLKPGDLYPITEYGNLEGRFGAPIRRLALVTPRGTNVWLVAVLERPRLEAVIYRARMNRISITDITALRAELPLDDAFLLGRPQSPRVLSPAQAKLIPGADQATSPEEFMRESETRADEEHRQQLAKWTQSIAVRMADANIEMPPLLRTLFERAIDRKWFERFAAAGVELGFEVDVDDEDIDERPQLVPFAADGFGNGYCLSVESPGATPCVLFYSHEDGSLEFLGHDVTDWLARLIADDDAEYLRAELPPLVRADRPMPESLHARGVRARE